MKILQVVPYFYPAWAYGGPGKLVYDTSMEFCTRGHEVTVYTSDAYDATSRMPSAKRVTSFQVHYFHNLSNWLAFHSNMYLPVGLFFRAPFEIGSFDVIHIHDFYTLANIWVTLWARLYRVPYIISVHGCLESKRRQQKSLFKDVFLRVFGRMMLTNAAALVATSPNEVKDLREFASSSNKIVNIRHGVNADEFTSKHSKKSCRAALHLPESSLIFTFVGRIHSIKGLDLLVEAFSALQDKNVHLVIAGSDEGFLERLQSLVQKHSLRDRVHFMGSTFGERKAKLFRASDVFVYPSRSEGFSLGILEAASVGLPLLLTKACHFQEVATIGAGLVVDTSIPSLLTGMRQFVAMTTPDRLSMGNRAKELIAKKYSTKSIGDQLEKMYLNVTK